MPRKRKKPAATGEFWILYHLRRTGFIQKCDLSLSKGEKDDRYLQKVIKKAVEDGYIGTIYYNRSDCCFITEKGAKRLCDLAKRKCYHNELMDEFAAFYSGKTPCEGWQPTERKAPVLLQKRTALYRKRLEEEGKYNEYFRSDLRKGIAFHIMRSADVIVYSEDKPDFDTFLQVLSEPNYKETFLWKLIREHGIYYTADEMKSETRTLSSRFTGALYTEHGCYRTFNMLERVSKWIPTTEAETNEVFTKCLNGTLPYRNQPAASLILTIGNAMVATLVSSYKAGVKKAVKPGFVAKKLEAKKAKNEKYMNVTNMKSVSFDRIYLAETNSRGLESLWWRIHTTPEEAAEEYEIIARDNPDLFMWVATINGRVLQTRESGQDVLIQRIYDLVKLQKLRNSANKVFVLGYDWQASATSKALAKSFGQFVSMKTGELVETPKYDADRKKVE